MMKKSLLLLTIAAMLLPMSMMAQTYRFTTVDGLKYIYEDGDDPTDNTKLFIIVNGSLTVDGENVSNRYFVPADGVRAAWRHKPGENEGTCIRKIDGTPLGSDRWYKSDMDAITEFLGTWGNNGPTSFQGIEYFRNITSITVKQNQNTTGSQLALDLSKNTQLTSLSFATPATARLKSLNISNTQLTSLTLPSGSQTTLSSLNLRNCTKLAETYTSPNPLDLTAYTNLSRFSVLVSGSGLVIGESVLVGENTNVTVLDIDAKGEDIDLNDYTNLLTLTCWNAKSLDVSALSNLQTLNIRGTENTNLILSKDNTALTTLDVSKSGMKSLDLSGDVPGTLGTPETCLAPNLTDFKCWFSDLKYLDLSFHTKLTYTNDFNTTRLKIIPPLTTNEANQYPTGDQIPRTDAGIELYHQKDSLRVIKLRGCTGLVGSETSSAFRLSQVELTDPANPDKTYPVVKSALEEVDLSGCAGIGKFECMNSLLKKLNLSGCTALTVINVHQGMLTGNGDIDITGCDNLTGLLAHRNQWETLDWLLTRPADQISKLTQIQVNGGSYTMYGINGTNDTRYVRAIYNEETGEMDTLKYTCRLKSLDLSNVSKTNFNKLFCEDNLLTELVLPDEVAASLIEFQCRNNMLTSLNLNKLNHTNLSRNSRWSPQVAFVHAEIVHGDNNVEEDLHQGKHDWIAVHLENGGYTHQLDNTARLYHNLYDAINNPTGSVIGVEKDPWICSVEDTYGIDRFVGDLLCANGHSGQHLFIHSQSEIVDETGNMNFKDQDLYGKLMTYRYNTGFNQNLKQNPVSGKMDFPDITDPITTKEGIQDPHITVRMHIWPYIMNINPISLNAETEAKGVKSYSGTIYLDYDALIPKGVQVYFITGFKNTRSIIVGGNTIVENQLDPQIFGDGDQIETDNNILPAWTPVYVRAKKSTEVGAGLYAFQPLWEFDIKGWENLRGDNEERDHILHGVENNTKRKTMDKYKGPLDLAKIKKASMTNILTGISGQRHTENASGIYDPNYSKYIREDTTVDRRTVLTLCPQTQKKYPDANGVLKPTNIIGFWPFNGTKLAYHRCVILEEDYNKAVEEAKKKGYSVATAQDSKGGMFYILDEDLGGVTGITTVDEEPANIGDEWYNVQGVRLNSRPTRHGVYIHNGKKVTIK